jgi:Zn-dependent peptidase ImmA (M78 family)
MKEITFQDAQKIVNQINGKEGTRKTFAEAYGMSENTLSRRLKSFGYTYNQTTKKYDFTSPTTNERKNGKTKNQKSKRTEEPRNEPTMLIRKRTSFDIDIKLMKELKIYAIQRDKNVYEIVEQAIKQYLRDEK